MREIRTSGSEGGGAELNRLSLPLSGPAVRAALTRARRDRSLNGCARHPESRNLRPVRTARRANIANIMEFGH